jgi:hypothetical protein
MAVPWRLSADRGLPRGNYAIPSKLYNVASRNFRGLSGVNDTFEPRPYVFLIDSSGNHKNTRVVPCQTRIFPSNGNLCSRCFC